MKKIDTAFDTVINANYNLYATTLFQLRDIVKNQWYANFNIDYSEFDNRYVSSKDVSDILEMKKSGLLSNFFVAYYEHNKYYLLDGFNRLLSENVDVEEDVVVYLKVITDKLSDGRLMSIISKLNLWKIKDAHDKPNIMNYFFDRGIRLLLYVKYGISLYYHDKKDGYSDRKRDNDDINAIRKYFVKEHEYADYFIHDFADINILLSSENIINDIKDIIESNDYRTPEFNNFAMFLHGYCMFLSYKRLNGYNGEMKFSYYLNKLKENKPFFKKLVGMSGNDSTRKNIYKFYRELDR